MNEETDIWCQVVRSGMKERKLDKVLQKAQGAAVTCKVGMDSVKNSLGR